jgi:hypothetical protein
MAETRLEAYGHAAGLLRNLGYIARAEAAWTPPGRTLSVVALISDAPEIVVGYALAITASEPEAHLPDTRAFAGRPPPGKPGESQSGWYREPA